MTWKGKSTTSTNPKRPTAIQASGDDSGTGSDISGSDNDRRKSESNDSEGEDSEPESKEDDFGATRMTEGEARRMFNNKVTCFCLIFIPLRVLIQLSDAPRSGSSFRWR